MKITKRLAKEVHNEKVKSFDEGYQSAKEELLNLNKSSHKMIWDMGYNKAKQEFIEMIDKMIKEREDVYIDAEELKKSLGGKDE